MKSTASLEHIQHPNDISVYEPSKVLGILAADVRARPEDAYIKAGLPLDPERPVLELHMNPTLEPGDLGAQAGRRSLEMVAQYIQSHPEEIQAQQIIGLTHPRLGRLATRFGFEHIPIFAEKLPINLRNKILGMDHGKIVAVRQSTADFVNRFGPRFRGRAKVAHR